MPAIYTCCFNVCETRWALGTLKRGQIEVLKMWGVTRVFSNLTWPKRMTNLLFYIASSDILNVFVIKSRYEQFLFGNMSISPFANSDYDAFWVIWRQCFTRDKQTRARVLFQWDETWKSHWKSTRARMHHNLNLL